MSGKRCHVAEQIEETMEEKMVTPLLDWYEMNARSLPWRDDPTPYHVWISEIMLQQTRVEAVKEYYARFIGELPDIAALAQVDEERLLKLWEGLGYYSRARNLKKAAVIVMEQYQGRLPRNKEELIKLPGIGAYTAGAVSSIAYGRKAAAVDGNVLRVMSRLTGSRENIAAEQVKKRLTERIEAIMPEAFPGAFNQALMDLGAMVCLPNGEPRCGECPLADLCTAFHQNIQNELPVKAPKKPRRREEKTILILETPQGFLVRKRPARGLLAGMWEFPAIEGRQDEETVRRVIGESGWASDGMTVLGSAKHIFSHIEWEMQGIYARLSAPKEGQAAFMDCIPVTWERLEQEYSVPAAFDAYREAIRKMRQNSGK